MTVGMVLDYIYEYMELISPEENKHKTGTKGTKEDFENYFGF